MRKFFSCAQKFLSFRTAQNFRSEDAQISFRKKIYFLAEEKIFSCGRKFISVRTKINFRICENKISYIRKFDALQTRWECGF